MQFKTNELINILEANINTGKLIVDGYEHMQIGKTTALFKVAKKYNIPVVVHLKEFVNIFKKEFGYEQIYWIGDILSHRVMTEEIKVNGVLIEGRLSIDQLYKLRRIAKIRTGFHYNDFALSTIEHLKNTDIEMPML